MTYLLISPQGHVKNYKLMAAFVGLSPGVQAYSVGRKFWELKPTHLKVAKIERVKSEDS